MEARSIIITFNPGKYVVDTLMKLDNHVRWTDSDGLGAQSTCCVY